MDICKDCSGPVPLKDHDGLDNCYPVTNYKKYYTSDYYSFHGPSLMKSEIYEYGPISCGIYATEKLHNYKGGIFSQITT